MCVLTAITAWGLQIMGFQGIAEEDQDCRSTIEGFKEGTRKPADEARIQAIHALSKHKCSKRWRSR